MTSKPLDVEIVRVPILEDGEAQLALTWFQNPPSGVDLVKGTIGQKRQLEALQVTYGLTLHCLIREKFDSKHVIPDWRRFKQSRESAKIYAHYWRCLLEVCLQLHCSGNGYASGYQRFGFVASELRNEDFAMVRNGDTSGKAAAVDTLGSELKTLRQGRNPYGEFRTPDLHSLIETALKTSKGSDRFREEYWNPLLTALGAHIRNVKESSAWACGRKVRLSQPSSRKEV